MIDHGDGVQLEGFARRLRGRRRGSCGLDQHALRREAGATAVLDATARLTIALTVAASDERRKADEEALARLALEVEAEWSII